MNRTVSYKTLGAPDLESLDRLVDHWRWTHGLVPTGGVTVDPESKDERFLQAVALKPE